MIIELRAMETYKKNKKSLPIVLGFCLATMPTSNDNRNYRKPF